MDRIKKPSVAGSFYTANSDELFAQVTKFFQESKNSYKESTRLVIVPHAGLFYSGRLAFEGIDQINRGVKNLFIFAPAHHVPFEGIALSSFDGWETPFGVVEINKEICNELKDNFGAKFYDEAFENEHSVEIQVPLIQALFEDIKIIPVLIGKENPDKIENIIQKYYDNPQNGFIISSDLSHFLTDEKARQMDRVTAGMIESGNINGFKYEQACGAVAICGAVNFANKNKFSFIRIDMTNSSTVSSDKNRVVGYGCWFLYEGNKNEFIAKNLPIFIIQLVKLVLKSSFSSENITINYPQVLDEPGACFVTLEKFGQLRGCIGSIVAYRPLLNDLVDHAKNAAFKDTRFNPVTFEELKDLKVSVSILTEPEKMSFDSEEDLLEQIKQNEDGIIIKDKNYQAVYLPSVWEQLPDKKMFLNSLKVKAGLDEDYFSPTFEAYRFKTYYIKEK